jgi:hypothetical protein
MLECVGNYSIPTANGNVQGPETLAGAGILNFLNIYAPHYSADNSRGWCLVSSVVLK